MTRMCGEGNAASPPEFRNKRVGKHNRHIRDESSGAEGDDEMGAVHRRVVRWHEIRPTPDAVEEAADMPKAMLVRGLAATSPTSKLLSTQSRRSSALKRTSLKDFRVLILVRFFSPSSAQEPSDFDVGNKGATLAHKAPCECDLPNGGIKALLAASSVGCFMLKENVIPTIPMAKHKREAAVPHQL
eukprot:CAMPEP_0117471056 /NCGR_PEP_ID=MMETSP0784-20121206/7538_1 /TAXON_ID=39447 /ORGANISM="" /LENGTH=185 /DNA_ID=CAMNT_0005265171 /DNA_START=199 /DNA_END=756 /DNA_ORIENTATION=-